MTRKETCGKDQRLAVYLGRNLSFSKRRLFGRSVKLLLLSQSCDRHKLVPKVLCCQLLLGHPRRIRGPRVFPHRVNPILKRLDTAAYEGGNDLETKGVQINLATKDLYLIHKVGNFRNLFSGKGMLPRNLRRHLLGSREGGETSGTSFLCRIANIKPFSPPSLARRRSFEAKI